MARSRHGNTERGQGGHRTTSATQLLGAGVPVRDVAARLGHAQASTTLNVYAHAIPGKLQADTIAGIVGRG